RLLPGRDPGRRTREHAMDRPADPVSRSLRAARRALAVRAPEAPPRLRCRRGTEPPRAPAGRLAAAPDRLGHRAGQPAHLAALLGRGRGGASGMGTGDPPNAPGP